ncbi:hypothetical protein [Gluconobacter wancherniae]|uniref:hypothetical protein n=1 Tax=Gluconobacter wancherniae TaxID=1307955 RepID=UPI002012999B|nr:hypothetical protein [Gluconobacter wancherniae]
MKTSFCTGQPKQRLGFLTGKIQISEDFDRMGQDDLLSLFFGLEGHPDVSQNDDQSVPDEPGSDVAAGA